MYKVTMYGKTFVGNNEDHWDANTRLWFEKGKTNEYGCMYVGYDNLFPQGGMNEKGLVYDGFYIDPYQPRHKSKKPIFEASMGKTIMKTCQNVDEVYNFLNKYDLSSFSSAMVLFVDKAGNYLVVEADTLIKGNDDKYVLSNFCPSRTYDLNAVDIPFYQSGRKMLESKADTSLNYLKSLSDTMHQEWPNNTAGTLYTTIYDLNEGTVNLFFYHDYTKSLKFRLADQLIKNDTILIIPSMFPNNVDGQNQFQKFNAAKHFIELLKTTDLANDSLSMAERLKAENLERMIGFFENELISIGADFEKKKKINSAINVFNLNIKYSPYSSVSYEFLGYIYSAYKKYRNYDLALMY
jgi:hypothetical protein